MINAFSLDDFPCGLVVTTVEQRKIISANDYFRSICERELNVEHRISAVFTPASQIMLESFVVPLLLEQQHCEEIQLTVKTASARRVPVLVNARILPQRPDLIYWVVTVAQQRDSLYQELVNLRNNLELKAERLEALSETDELTGLLNRRAFITQAKAIIKQANRIKLAYSFYMIDIDNFKEINDQYGHDVGDEVLRKIAAVFRQNCRENDVLARIGGEEFAIITMIQSTDCALKFADKILRVVSADKIEGLKVTASIGLAVSYQASLKQLFKFADVLLYQAKNNGKNQFVSQFVDEPADS